MTMDFLPDRYTRGARLLPALLVVLPVSLVVALSIALTYGWAGAVVGVVAGSGLPFLATQLVRDRGLAVEPRLYTAWGGKPTTRLLRWRGPEPIAEVRRRHEIVARCLAVALPDDASEAADPLGADAAYDGATTVAREHTRDTARFGLLFQENIAYGFRRNLYACRNLAIAIALLTAVATPVIAWAVISLSAKIQAVLIAFDLLWILALVLVVTDDWVKRAAERYAKQLFASLESLDRPAVSTT